MKLLEYSSVTALEPFLNEDMRPCANCGGEQIFIEVFEFAGGRAGYCLGCGEEKLVPFTRTTAEAV